MNEDKLEAMMGKRGVTRRDFLKFCSAVALTLGLQESFVPRIAEALTGPRPRVLWLHFSECTGCTESALRCAAPTIDRVILETISLDYHETLLAGAGHDVEATLFNTANQYTGQFLCVVEGSIPTAGNGQYGMIGGRTMLDIARTICPKSFATIALGTCAAYGGLAAAAPNPTGARGVKDALGTLMTKPVVNVAGCPPNPVNFISTIANYLLFDRLPALDSLGRPTFAYGRRVHDQCPYRENESRCLEDAGCKGERTYNNCPTMLWNEGTSWDVQAGHPCIGCAQPNFWDTMSPFYQGD